MYNLIPRERTILFETVLPTHIREALQAQSERLLRRSIAVDLAQCVAQDVRKILAAVFEGLSTFCLLPPSGSRGGSRAGSNRRLQTHQGRSGSTRSNGSARSVASADSFHSVIEAIDEHLMSAEAGGGGAGAAAAAEPLKKFQQRIELRFEV